MDSASATLESPLDSSKHIIAQFLCLVQRFPAFLTEWFQPSASCPPIQVMSAKANYALASVVGCVRIHFCKLPSGLMIAATQTTFKVL
jgi:hypothetical protein